MRPLITESSLRLAYFFFQLALKSPFASAQSYRVPILCGSLESLPEVTYTFSSVYYHFITSKYNCQFLLPILFVNFCNFACAPEILSVKPETVAQKKISVFIAVCLSVSKCFLDVTRGCPPLWSEAIRCEMPGWSTIGQRAKTVSIGFIFAAVSWAMWADGQSLWIFIYKY